MGLTTLPTETDGSLGIDKEDISAAPNTRNYIPAAEHNARKRAIREIAEAIGLSDGTTSGSLEKLRRWVTTLESVDTGRFGRFDDFLEILTDRWLNMSADGGAFSLVNGDDSVARGAGAGVGLLLLSTTASATSVAATMAKVSTLNGAMGPLVCEAKIRTPATLTGCRTIIGLADNTDLSGSHAVLEQNAGVWQSRVGSVSGGQTGLAGSLGTPVAATWYRVRVELDPDVEARFYLDDVLISTMTTADAVPDESDRFGEMVALENTLANTRSAYCDFIGVRGQRA